MKGTIASWLSRKWQRQEDTLAEDYRMTFGSLHGQKVLQHLLDEIYCRCYEGTDGNGALIHNARRSVVQEILENIDQAERPDKYLTKTEDTHAFAR